MLKKKIPNFVSIVIPAYNEEKNIGRCLDSIVSMNLAKDTYEVIIVDNGSTDKTYAIASSFNTKISITILVHTLVNIATLRNIGVAHSKGDIIAFVDADCTVSNSWIETALEHFKDDKVGAVGCSVNIPENGSWVSRVWDLNVSKKRKPGFTRSLPTGNLFVRKALFSKIKGFDESLSTNEDFDFCFRLQNEGFNILSDPNIKVIHWGIPENLMQFYRRGKWHGVHAFSVFIKDIRKLRNIKAVLYAFYYLGCLSGLFAGLFELIIKGKAILLISSACAIVLPPALLSFRAIFSQHQPFKYFLPLGMLYLTYGIARAMSLTTNLSNLLIQKKIVPHWSATKRKKTS